MNLIQVLLDTAFTLGKVQRILSNEGYPNHAKECEERIQELKMVIQDKPLTVVVVKQ